MACTMSAFISKLWRYRYLPDSNSVCIPPEQGFLAQPRQSKFAFIFFKFIEQLEGVQFVYEKEFGTRSVDAYIEDSPAFRHVEKLRGVPVHSTLALELDGCVRNMFFTMGPSLSLSYSYFTDAQIAWTRRIIRQ